MLTFTANADNLITIWYSQVDAGVLDDCRAVFQSLGQPTAPPVVYEPTAVEHIDRYEITIPYEYSGVNLTPQDYEVNVQRLDEYSEWETVWTDLCKVEAA